MQIWLNHIFRFHQMKLRKPTQIYKIFIRTHTHWSSKSIPLPLMSSHSPGMSIKKLREEIKKSESKSRQRWEQWMHFYIAISSQFPPPKGYTNSRNYKGEKGDIKIEANVREWFRSKRRNDAGRCLTKKKEKNCCNGRDYGFLLKGWRKKVSFSQSWGCWEVE